MFTTRKQRRDNMKKIALGSTIAGIAGYVTGLLTAPQSGKDTRKDIKDNANKGVAEAEKDFKKLQADLDKTLKQAQAQGSSLRGRAKTELNDLSDKAKDSREKVREVFGAVREGEPKDEDLAKAMKQAGNALNNLKKYLKK